MRACSTTILCKCRELCLHDTCHISHIIMITLQEAQWPIMVSTLYAGTSRQSGFESWPRHCVVFLGTTLYSLSASLRPRCNINNGYRQISAGGNPTMDKLPIQGGVEILLVASCQEKLDKLWPNGPLVCRFYLLW